ncbi:MAG: type I glyceraldehyde-3-phosphate dehydrogenase [Desulfobacca sp. 4484_104]|nr:MAG: type I glyceraldehyde-3-phosphate dehydrogenase [Desulfobacca sp. 4484_104]RLA88674.1 MAG: type I glyceraldehyde-3-phosphate dehydrogenase [Deltaproteobacteria bacterium]
MPVRIAVNGFGRIGRYLTRISLAERQDVDLVAINSRGDTETLAHLLRYDSIHGPFHGTVEAKADSMIINGKEVHITRIDDPHQLPWKELGVQIVLESTGAFRDRISNEGHLASGAHKVIIGAPGKKIDATFVYGVNHETYDPTQHQIVSNASCTTNCLAPVAKVLNDNFGLEYGLMTTIHSYTMDQRLLDGSHKDLRRARAAALSMVPTSTGAARMVTEVIPELQGRLDGLAVRVPTANVSVVDLVAQVKKSTSKEEVNQALAQAAASGLKDILHVSALPLVSIDYNGSPYSAIVDAELTNVMGGNLVKVMTWYDNESGFSHRMIDMAVYLGQHPGN